MASKELRVQDYSQGQDYDITLDVDGKYLNVVDLVPVATSKAS
jgi:hypothetical protein